MLIYYKYAFPLEHMGPCCADLSTKPFLHLPLQLLTVTPQEAVIHSPHLDTSGLLLLRTVVSSGLHTEKLCSGSPWQWLSPALGFGSTSDNALTDTKG